MNFIEVDESEQIKMKKKVVFMVINMNIGGTEKALLNLIAEIPQEDYDITILMLEKKGRFLQKIPNHVHIEYLAFYRKIKNELNDPPIEVIKKSVKQLKFIRTLMLTFLYVLSKVTKERSLFYKYLLKDILVQSKEYDVAVAYAGPMDFISYFVAHKIKSKRKIQWIHFDIQEIGFNKWFAKKIYQLFDKVFVVSNEGKEKLIKMLPSLSHQTDVFMNVISPDVIKSEAIKGVGFQDGFHGIKILTVGRLTLEKGQDIAIQVLSRLIRNGYHVRWYCLGEGSARKEYEEIVENLHMQDHFIFLGAHANPYPYVKESDIYVQPSRHEGYCITLAEARMLEKPIITTNFTGAKEQIENGKTGFIVESNAEEIYEAIKTLINQPYTQKMFKKNLAKETVEHLKNADKLLYFD